MLIRSILLTAVLAGRVWAEHGGTKAFEERNRKAREASSGKVTGERMKIHWDADALYHEKPGGGWVKVTLADGRKEEVEKRPESAKPAPGGGDRRRGRRGGSGGSTGALSPDQAWAVSVKDGKVMLEARKDGGESRTIKVPRPDNWVLNDRVMWSPNSDRFVVWRRPDEPQRQVHYVRSSPKDQVQPEHFTRTYTKPGDPLNVPQAVVCFTDGREPMLLDEALTKDPYQLRSHRWRKDGRRLTLEFTERGFGVFRVVEMDTEARTQRTVVEEASDKFVFVSGKTFRRDFDDGNEILWMSERDGWNHLYLMDGRTGKVKRQLTKGQWVVRDVVRVDDPDEEGGQRSMLLKVGGYYPDQDPYFIHWARVGIDDGSFTRLTEGNGTHELEFAPDGEYYVDRWSRVDQPPVHELRRSADGALVAELARADASELLGTGWTMPEPFKTTDRNGRHAIWGVIHRPRNFDAARTYPVVEKIYAGPHGSFVPKSWRTWHGTAAEFCEAGFIVVQIDGLGTSHRSRDFHQVAYKNLMDSGFPDRVKWIRAAAAKYPQMDISRVGIFGGSAGGQSTLAALLTHGDFYRAGVADCGCHDNRMDKTWWNEQWMDWPVDESYAANSNVTHAAKLQGALLLTVGEVDTNVDPSSTMQVVDALIAADKDFEMLLVPNGGHGIGERPHLRRKRVEFFQRTLGGPKGPINDPEQ